MSLSPVVHHASPPGLGVYVAHDATHRYRLRGAAVDRWCLFVYPASLHSPVAADTYATSAIGLGVLREFSALGDGYDPEAHGGRDRLTEAFERAWAAIRAGGTRGPRVT